MKLERIAEGWTFPTSLTFDDSGRAYVTESGLPFGGAPSGGRLWRLSGSGERELLVEDLRPPVNGVTYYEGGLYVSEAGPPGRIIRFGLEGGRQTVLDGLPGPGNYHTNKCVFGPDDRLYFSQGAMTNSGVVGLDAYELGWLRRLPHAHDAPGLDVVLAGINFETADPMGLPDSRTLTGGFVPFGTATEPGQVIPGQLPCTAAVMRCQPDGTELELVAWGLRNAYGLAFLPDGRLLALDQGADDRGSRPIGNAPDLLYEVVSGTWYGWPDYLGGRPVTDATYRPERGPAPQFLLAAHDRLPAPQPALFSFPPHSAPTRLAVSGRELVIALFGDERPMTAPDGPRRGRALATFDLAGGRYWELVSRPLSRPIDVAFGPDKCLYVLDFGRFEVDGRRGVVAAPQTGVLWRLG